MQKKIDGKKINPTLSQKIEISNWYHANGRKKTTTAKNFIEKYPDLRFGNPRIFEWLKDEEKMGGEYNAGIGLHSKQRASTKHPRVTQSLKTWVTQDEHLGMVLNGSVIHAI